MAEMKNLRGAGVLYVVATPIGNPGDLTARALEALRSADLIACEDTRRTGVLLAAHRIEKPMLSYFEHNEERRVPDLIERLKAGAIVALVTDAGTPAISDPGYRLVRAALEAGVRVSAIPGACAAIAALSISGIPSDRFAFEGFLPPREGARTKALDPLRDEPRTLVFYEAARRLAGTLGEMAAIFGGDRIAAVIREITKTHEETVRGSLAELAARYAREQALGEVVIVVEGAGGDTAAAASPPALTMQDLLEAGVSLKQASQLMAKLTGRSRRDIYQEGLKLRRPQE